jgi:hypothetical protein
VVPPSVHPETGRQYFWLDDLDLYQVSLDSLPTLPADYTSIIEDCIRECNLEPDPPAEEKVYEAPVEPDGIFASINARAMSDFASWVPALGLPKTRRLGNYQWEAVPNWRQSSRGAMDDSRRDPNLSFKSKAGIMDFGASKGYSPIDVVMAARKCSAGDALDWLKEQLGVDEPDVEVDDEAIKANETLRKAQEVMLEGATFTSQFFDFRRQEGEADFKTGERVYRGVMSARELADRDDIRPITSILGKELFHTAVRALLVGATGKGKTQLAMAAAFCMADGKPLMHWGSYSAVKVLYIDGDMNVRQLRKRVRALEKRHGPLPDNLHFLSHQDVENFKPLNTPEGQDYIWKVIVEGGYNFVFFDSIMCLTLGDQKDPAVWQQTQPLINKINAADIGQCWIHHTGHNEDRGYGDKSREWLLDTVMVLKHVPTPDRYISFNLTFPKKRDQDEENSADYAESYITLAGDEWISRPLTDEEKKAAKAKEPSQMEKARDALYELQRTQPIEHEAARDGIAVRTRQWKGKCIEEGISAEAGFDNLKWRMKAADLIGVDKDLVWVKAV